MESVFTAQRVRPLRLPIASAQCLLLRPGFEEGDELDAVERASPAERVGVVAGVNRGEVNTGGEEQADQLVVVAPDRLVERGQVVRARCSPGRM